MFEQLSHQADDPLLALIGAFRSDPRPGKVDLGVGVYRDETGRTPIFRAVKAAEQRLWEAQETKAYVGPEGDGVFLDRLWELVAGTGGRAGDGVQTPGGSGALRLAAELVRAAGSRRIWLGLPSWPNHAGIFGAAGLQIAPYPFFDVPTQALAFDRMIAALETAEAGDVALFHASCHNPTGAALSSEHWAALADVVEKRGILPMVDLAYQGFGRGLDEDAAGLRHLLGRVPEALVAVSCSKSFGIYRERTGAIYAVGEPDGAARARSNLVGLARTGYSMPPDHGAAVVRMILETPELKADWAAELDGMRRRIAAVRRRFAAGLAAHVPALAAIGDEEGMFSLLPLSPEQVNRLKSEHAIYMPGSGRINVAGLKEDDIDRVVAAIAGCWSGDAGGLDLKRSA